METKRRQFWRSLPGIVTAAAALITAVTGLVVAVTGTGLFSPRAQPAEVSGQWQAAVTYSWGDAYTERFVFNLDGERLTGLATYLGVPRPLTNGVVSGEEISFVVPLEELIGAERRSYELRYVGVAVNAGIHFRVMDSRGNPDIQFAASRSLP